MVFSEKRVNSLVADYRPTTAKTETFVSEDITLVGRCAVPYYKDGNMMPEFWHVIAPNIISPGQYRRMDGLTVSLVAVWGNNYFHWVTECLTLLCSLDFDKITRILIPRWYEPFVLESLVILGLADKVVLWDEQKTTVNLYHTSPQRPGGYPQQSGLENLRRCFNVKGTGSKRIYISRKDASKRRVVNEQDIIKHLEGFEVVKLRGMSFRQQLDYFAEVGEIVAPHGAGITNLLWTGTKLTELFGDYHHTCYAFMALSLDMPYKSVTLKAVGNDMIYRGEAL